MRARAWEFRLRVVIMVALISIGFWSPWIQYLGLGRRISLLEWLALELSRTGLVHFTQSTALVIVLASLIAAIAAILRLWGTAYLGTEIVNGFEMKAGHVLADGPYRYVRNPLYLGTWGMIAAICFAMPASGALFTLVLLTVFLLRLILGEEAFLSARLGEPYRAYYRAVPRLIPRLRTTIPPSHRPARWLRAVLAETNGLGVFVIMAALTWRFDNDLLVRAILINFGISLVLRALLAPMERRPASA